MRNLKLLFILLSLTWVACSDEKNLGSNPPDAPSGATTACDIALCGDPPQHGKWTSCQTPPTQATAGATGTSTCGVECDVYYRATSGNTCEFDASAYSSKGCPYLGPETVPYNRDARTSCDGNEVWGRIAVLTTSVPGEISLGGSWAAAGFADSGSLASPPDAPSAVLPAYTRYRHVSAYGEPEQSNLRTLAVLYNVDETDFGGSNFTIQLFSKSPFPPFAKTVAAELVVHAGDVLPKRDYTVALFPAVGAEPGPTLALFQQQWLSAPNKLGIRVIHAQTNGSAAAGPVDICYDTNLADTTPAGTLAADIAWKSATAYVEAETEIAKDSKLFAISSEKDCATATVADILFQSNVPSTMAPGSSYTLFLVGNRAAAATPEPEIIAVQDKSAPASR